MDSIGREPSGVTTKVPEGKQPGWHGSKGTSLREDDRSLLVSLLLEELVPLLGEQAELANISARAIQSIRRI